VKYLLDTHVFLWAITGDTRLKKRHVEIFEAEESELYLSAASIWEVLIKTGIGRLDLPQPVATYLSREMDANRVRLLPIRMNHLEALEDLPPVHRDPFDRMIVAQALSEGLRLVSSDTALKGYPVKLA